MREAHGRAVPAHCACPQRTLIVGPLLRWLQVGRLDPLLVRFPRDGRGSPMVSWPKDSYARRNALRFGDPALPPLGTAHRIRVA
jgi:hypothetical protein